MKGNCKKPTVRLEDRQRDGHINYLYLKLFKYNIFLFYIWKKQRILIEINETYTIKAINKKGNEKGTKKKSILRPKVCQMVVVAIVSVIC